MSLYPKVRERVERLVKDLNLLDQWIAHLKSRGWSLKGPSEMTIVDSIGQSDKLGVFFDANVRCSQNDEGANYWPDAKDPCWVHFYTTAFTVNWCKALELTDETLAEKLQRSFVLIGLSSLRKTRLYEPDPPLVKCMDESDEPVVVQ